jgi:phage-related protein
MIYREGSFNFEFESYHTFDDSNEATSWAKTYSDVLCALHGRKMKIVLEDDPLYFYYGVVSVEWKNDKRSQITIGVYCEPYKYKEYTAHSVNRTSKATITPDTKFVTPAIVTITPIQDIVELTITGLSRNPITGAAEDIVLSSLKANAAVTIDGESKLILQGGENKYSDSDFWNFPTVIPGSNSLTFSSTLCNVNIKYKPRYL